MPAPLLSDDDLLPPRVYSPRRWYVTDKGVTFRVIEAPKRILQRPEDRARKELHTGEVEHPDGTTSRLVWDARTTSARKPWPLYYFF